MGLNNIVLGSCCGEFKTDSVTLSIFSQRISGNLLNGWTYLVIILSGTGLYVNKKHLIKAIDLWLKGLITKLS